MSCAPLTAPRGVPSTSAGPLGRDADFPVNTDRSFTGNCGSLAEYRVNTCRIALKIPPSKDDYHLLRRHT